MFSTPQPLLDLVSANRTDRSAGLPSVCSAHAEVLLAAMEHASGLGTSVLIEATSNQVNQEGGYTGMTPQQFAAYVGGLAGQAGLPRQQVLLGGDHLGPNPWRKESAAAAMDKAKKMVADYVAAGFSKIHLDASMALGGEAHPADVLIAQRAAELCRAAEGALPAGMPQPVYVIGTEVPTPGGVREETGLQITRPSDALATVEAFRNAFSAAGLEGAWQRVIALVVQPGVEFGDAEVHKFVPEEAKALSAAIEGVPGLIYEAHSTDYQSVAALRQLVHDHFALLKVGPWLTFAWREAMFGLAHVEAELGFAQPSNLIEALLETMRADPRDWEPYYHGSPGEIEFKLKYSLSDRSRYYWLREPVRSAVERLFANLSAREIPEPLLSQFLPAEMQAVREGDLQVEPRALARARVKQILDLYALACGQMAKRV